MKHLKSFLYVIVIGILLVSCQDDLDDRIFPADAKALNNFVWNAMNIFYLYNEDSPDLGDDRFASNQAYNDFLEGFSQPEDLFEHLKVNEDRFSIIVSDFRVLENALSGIRVDNGMRFGLVGIDETNDVFGYIRYVVPNSPADQVGLKRGMIFNRIDGQTFTTETNFNELFSPEVYTLGLADFVEDELTSLDDEVQLIKIEISENPIHYHDILDFGSTQVGYLVMNNFRRNFDNQLNAVFGEFKAGGINELVLDLRYNGGGDLRTAIDLASMITGQFPNELFINQIYNANFDNVSANFTTQNRNEIGLNSLQLERLYVLTTSSSASASEVLILGLQPYIDVVQIGTTTTGKFEGSTTLYDSPNFRRQDASIHHNYALQPIIFSITNAIDEGGNSLGLVPEIQLSEEFRNIKAFGNLEETLLQQALIEIGVVSERKNKFKSKTYTAKILAEDGQNNIDFQRMYIDLKDDSPYDQ
ncbi:MAG: peptidase S41 [Flavobacteriaceae bacterium]|nr:peptidase S41 [Flavobacteriaceae bacterium]